jgi:predicted NACHT family NTPase
MVRLLLVSQAVAFIVPQPRHQQSTSLWAAREKAAAPAKAIAVVGEPGSGQTTFAK